MVNEVSSAEEVAVGLATARAKRLVAVAFMGKTCSRLGECAQYCACVPPGSTARIQEFHNLNGHILYEIADARLAPR